MKRGVLVLDSTYLPVSITGVYEAVSKVVCNKAIVVESDPDRKIRSERMVIDAPQVLRLNRFTGYKQYAKIKIKLNKASLLQRDQFECQYCGHEVSEKSATVDHVIPKSRGGKSTWINYVIACKPCNSLKGNRTPEEANMTLLSNPAYPHYLAHLNKMLEREMKDNSTWKQYFIL